MRTTLKHSKVGRTSRAALAAVLAAGLVAVLAAPAGARVAEKNDKFCAVLQSGQGSEGIDFEGLGTAEAQYAADLMRKLAKTGVPASLKKNLKKVAKVYDRIADGASESEIAGEQDVIIKALTQIGRYTGKNCVPDVPGT